MTAQLRDEYSLIPAGSRGGAKKCCLDAFSSWRQQNLPLGWYYLCGHLFLLLNSSCKIYFLFLKFKYTHRENSKINSYISLTQIPHSSVF